MSEDSEDDFSEMSLEIRQALALLNPKKAKFVLNICQGMKPIDAYLDAGWNGSRKIASAGANRLMKNDESVIDAIAVVKADYARTSKYSFEKFMGEMNEAMEFAKATKNATALVRAIELKGKANGHVVEKLDSRVHTTGFQLVVSGVEPPKESHKVVN